MSRCEAEKPESPFQARPARQAVCPLILTRTLLRSVLVTANSTASNRLLVYNYSRVLLPEAVNFWPEGLLIPLGQTENTRVPALWSRPPI